MSSFKNTINYKTQIDNINKKKLKYLLFKKQVLEKERSEKQVLEKERSEKQVLENDRSEKQVLVKERLEKQLENERLEKENNQKEQIIVCIVGVVNRSIKYTWSSIEDNIINELKKKYIVDIAIFNNNVEDCKVDGVVLNNKDLSIIPYDYFFEYKQRDIDKEIIKIKGYENEYPNYWCNDYKKNGIRLMYMESKIGDFLKNKKYKRALVTNSDYFYINKLNINKLNFNNNSIYLCNHLNFKGYTDGFYFGELNPIIKIMNRIKIYNELVTNLFNDHNCNINSINYEKILKYSFNYYKINKNNIDIIFTKIRANSKVILRWHENHFIQIYLEYLNKNKDKYPIYKVLLSNE